MKALERRLLKLEQGTITPGSIDAWIDRALTDDRFLKEEILRTPGRPGSREERINAELLDLMPSPEF